MELIEIRESSGCDLTQLEEALKTIREIIGVGDCNIEVDENTMIFLDGYGNDVAMIEFK